MGRQKVKHEQVIGKMISFLEEHLHETFTLEDVAKHTGYSVPWISSFFKKETGQSIWAHLLQMRVDRAAKLLRETDLTITEIAFEVGFNSYTRFGVAFRKQKGMSPGDFRKAANAAQDTPAIMDGQALVAKGVERFRDQFGGAEMASCWKVETGTWFQKDGTLRGQGEENIEITYTRPLPENLSLTFEFRFQEFHHLRTVFHGGDRSAFYLDVILGKHGNSIGQFIFPHSHHAWKDDLDLKENQWQEFRLALIDNTIQIEIDKRLVFSFRDPFPPTYLSRNHFTIGSWNNAPQIRNFSIFDHGFVSLVPAVRQGDSLYSNGMHERARNAYERLLESALAPADTAELQYKIGMCYLNQDMLLQARTWFSRVSPLPEANRFWHDRAQEGLLEADRLQGDSALFAERAKKMFSEPQQRDAVRACVRRAKDQLAIGGFLEKALACCDLLSEMERPDSILSFIAMMETTDLLFDLRRYEESEMRIHRIMNARGMPKSSMLWIMISLADCLSYGGRHRESDQVIGDVRALSKGQYLWARADIIHAGNLCNQQRFTEAIEFLSGVPDRYPAATEIGAFAWMKASHIYLVMGQVESAREIIARAEKRFPGNSHLRGHYRAQYYYPPLLVQGQYAAAAQTILDAAKGGTSLLMSANGMIRAGILYELSGDPNRALELWRETVRRFPAKRCNFYGPLAEELARGEGGSLEEMPCAALHRAEMFYLAGLLHKSRGKNDAAKKYFSLAVADDPTFNWFTWLSKEELAATTTP